MQLFPVQVTVLIGMNLGFSYLSSSYAVKSAGLWWICRCERSYWDHGLGKLRSMVFIILNVSWYQV